VLFVFCKLLYFNLVYISIQHSLLIYMESLLFNGATPGPSHVRVNNVMSSKRVMSIVVKNRLLDQDSSLRPNSQRSSLMGICRFFLIDAIDLYECLTSRPICNLCIRLTL